jgi:hypothetical protein
LKLKIDTIKFLVLASHSRGTAIKSSDLDLLQVVRKKELKWGDSLVSSNTLLANVRKALESYAQSLEMDGCFPTVMLVFIVLDGIRHHTKHCRAPGAVPQAGRLRPNRLAVRSSIAHLLESRLNRAEVLEYTQFLRFSEEVGTHPSSPEFTFFFL